jgi:hypothetical protein
MVGVESGPGVDGPAPGVGWANPVADGSTLEQIGRSYSKWAGAEAAGRAGWSSWPAWTRAGAGGPDGGL